MNHSSSSPVTAIVTCWSYHDQFDHGPSGLSPAGDSEIIRTLARYGHVILTDNRTDRAWNHHVSGCGVGHDDAVFAETGGRAGSMAAYYENGDAYGGRWWEDVDSPFSVGVKHYGMARQPGVRYCGKPTAESESIRRAGADL